MKSNVASALLLLSLALAGSGLLIFSIVRMFDSEGQTQAIWGVAAVLSLCVVASSVHVAIWKGIVGVLNRMHDEIDKED